VIGLKTLSLLLALIAALGCMADAHAQSFPSRPVTIVVPYGPGGPADILARIMAERMRGLLGQPVVVENVAGAAGTMGVSRVVRAAPDGYTLSYGNWGTHVLNGVIQKVNYDVLTDARPENHHPGRTRHLVARAVMLESVAAGFDVGIAAEIRQDEHRRLVGVLRIFLNGLPKLGAEAVAAFDAVDVEGECAGVRHIDVMQRDPEQTRGKPLHQVFGDVHRHLIRAGQVARVRREIVYRELEHFRHLIEFDLAAAKSGRKKRCFVVVAEKMLVACAIRPRRQRSRQQPFRKDHTRPKARTE